MKYLLDTCVISELVKKQPSERVLDWMEQQDEFSFYLSVITVGELHKGIGKLPDSKRKRDLQNWVEQDLGTRFTGRILSIDREIAIRWGEISASAEKSGRTIPVLDGLLAATALTVGLTLVTRNTPHIEPAGASLFDPWQT